MSKSLPKHGSRTRYVYGCRCSRCKKANSAYQSAYMERKRKEIEA